VLAVHAQRYVLLGAQKFRSGRGPAVEHKALRDAALAGDVDRAVTLLEGHLRGTLDSVRAALAKVPAISQQKSAPKPRRSSR
jgi:DNA-binding GntR family transcriptional regulator